MQYPWGRARGGLNSQHARGEVEKTASQPQTRRDTTASSTCGCHTGPGWARVDADASIQVVLLGSVRERKMPAATHPSRKEESEIAEQVKTSQDTAWRKGDIRLAAPEYSAANQRPPLAGSGRRRYRSSICSLELCPSAAVCLRQEEAFER